MSGVVYKLRHPFELRTGDGEVVKRFEEFAFPEFPKAGLIMSLKTQDFQTPRSTAAVLSLLFAIPVEVTSEKMHASDLMLLGGVVNDFLWGSVTVSSGQSEAQDSEKTNTQT